MKFNHLSLIKVESLTFWWSHRSVIWCLSSREKSEAGLVCAPRLLSCGWRSLSSSISSDCFLLLPVIRAFFPGGNENETVRCENWSRRDIMVPIGQGDSGQACAPHTVRGEVGECVCVCKSMWNQYSLDNLTSAFNSMCPYLCFVS